MLVAWKFRLRSWLRAADKAVWHRGLRDVQKRSHWRRRWARRQL